MNRQALNEIQADLSDVVSRVRDLDAAVAHHKAAALHSLSEAVYHLQRLRSASDSIPSVPPPDANHKARNDATQRFRNARAILEPVTKDKK